MHEFLRALVPTTAKNALSFFLLHGRFFVEGIKDAAVAVRYTPPVPPPKLRHRVHGSIPLQGFLDVGKQVAGDLTAMLADVGHAIPAQGQILDWGCGCGRVLRFLAPALPGRAYFGCDIDRELITWCQRHLDVGSFTHVDITPPLPYADAQFDFVYGISVLTHLDEANQDRWLAEVHRVLKPTGIAILTVHGRFDHDRLPAEKREKLERTGFLFDITSTGKFKADGLPEYYQTAYHTAAYIERHWSNLFRIVKHCEQGINHHQDAVILRKAV